MIARLPGAVCAAAFVRRLSMTTGRSASFPWVLPILLAFLATVERDPRAGDATGRVECRSRRRLRFERRVANQG